jgi:3-hydroxyacyl-[acyl-carrier-protein] dehydratase
MKPTDPFFQIADMELGESSLQATVYFPTEHPLYAGHFPERPVVPGVCVLQVCRDLIAKSDARVLRIAAIASVKYMIPLIPSAEMGYGLSLSWKQQEDGSLMVDGSWQNGQQIFVKLKGMHLTQKI